MTHKIKIFTWAMAAMVFFAACSKKFLNTQPLGSIPSEDTWKDGGLANAFVTNIYNGLVNGGFQEQEVASLSDEAVFVHPGRGINTINEGTLSPSNLGWIDPTYYWDSMDARIRSGKVALEVRR